MVDISFVPVSGPELLCLPLIIALSSKYDKLSATLQRRQQDRKHKCLIAQNTANGHCSISCGVYLYSYYMRKPRCKPPINYHRTIGGFVGIFLKFSWRYEALSLMG